jgi:hypothetical protein
MVSIAVEQLRGDRVATVSPALAPLGNTKSNFAHSLLANGVESVPKPATTETHVNKNAVASESEAPKKGATVGSDAAVALMKFTETESGSSEVQGSLKSVGMHSAAIVKGGQTAKNELVGLGKDARTAEAKKPEISEKRKPDISEMRNLDSPEAKKQAVTETKKSDVSETKHLEEGKVATGPTADETPAGDTVSVQSFTPVSGMSARLNGVNDSEALPTDSSVGPAGDKQSGSVTATMPISTTATHRETKGAQDDVVHPVKLSEGSSDTASTMAAKVEQPKNGAVSADLAGSGLTAIGKAETGIASAMAAGQHVNTGAPGQVHAAAFNGDGSRASFGPVAHQGSVADVTPSLTSHNSAYSSEHMLAGESGPGLLAATPTSLEVGIANGTHGWLKIRAEMEDGVVTASLSPGSMATQEMLHRELPSLVAYLQEEKLGVNTLVVKPSQMTDAMGSNTDGDLQRQGQSSQQRADRTWNGIGSGDESAWGRAKQGQGFESWNSFGGGGSGFLPAMISDIGSWLNVRV